VSILQTAVPGVLARSVVSAAGGEWALARAADDAAAPLPGRETPASAGGRRLVALLPRESPALAELEGERHEHAARVLLTGERAAPTQPFISRLAVAV